jgi:hypothetical protein
LKKYFKFVAYFRTQNKDRFLSVFTVHSTVFLPSENRHLHTVFSKTPPKNKAKQQISSSHRPAIFFRHATPFLLAFLTLPATAQITNPQPEPQIKKDKKPQQQQREDVEWLWQYSPPPADGRETDLVLDPRFRPFLAQYFTAPQTFWGNPKSGYKSLPDTALDFLSIPDKVLADDNRYLSITGSVFRFNPSRGLLWVDLNGAHHLVVFAAIDWIKESKTPSEPGAEYTLWVFPNHPIDPAHIPAPLAHSVARWTAQPPAGSKLIQQITNAILVDPDGTPHQIPPATIGANTLTEQKAQP